MAAFDLAQLAPQEAELAGLEPLFPPAPGRPEAELARSIAEVGLLRPLLLQEREGRRRLLGGFLRRKALLALGRSRAPALFVPPETPWVQTLALALADDSGRTLNQAEIALRWRFLEDNADRAEAESLAGALGLALAPKLRDRYRAAAGLPEKGLSALADGRLDLAAAARLARWAPADQAAVLELFEAVNPSVSKKREWLDWLEDIGRRENLTPAAVLEGLPNPASGEEVRAGLFNRRYPLLAELRRKRTAQIKALRLPPAIRLTTDPTFEDLAFGLEMTFASPADFQNLLQQLADLAANPAFKELML
jgi:ParB-like chromosome segregation protein Spo0J